MRLSFHTGELTTNFASEPKYERYLEMFEAACRRDYLQKHGHRCRLDLVLRNEGNATATSVESVLQFPAGSIVMRPQDEEEALDIPKEPQPKWVERVRSSWSNISGLSGSHFDFPASTFIKRDYGAEATYQLMRSQQRWKGPCCNDTGDTHIVTYRAEELLHAKAWELPSIIAYVWPDGASIDYRIHARELPRKIEEKLHIRWRSV